MESKNKIKCMRNNDATKACMMSTCQIPALMCNKQKCECTKHHKSCNFSISVNTLLHKMKSEGEKYLPALQKLKEWYEAQIKRISVELEQLTQVITQASLSLQGKQAKLYKFMHTGNCEKIVSKLIFDSVVSLGNPKGINYNKQMEQINKILDTTSEQIDEKLATLREKWKCQQNILSQYKFSQSKKAGYCVVSNNGKTVKLQNNNNNNHNRYKDRDRGKYGERQMQTYNIVNRSNNINIANQLSYCLLQPNLQQTDHSIKKYQFKINCDNGNGYLGFGVCQEENLSNNGYMNLHSGYNNQFYLFCSSGLQTSHSSQDKSTNFRMLVSDLIQLVYDSKNKKIQCFNKTTNTKSETLTLASNIDKKLYLCVRMYCQNDQIEYLGHLEE